MRYTDGAVYLHRMADKAMRARFHLVSTGEAKALLATLEARQKRQLSAHDRKSCDEYAHDVLGRGLYAPWLRVYAFLSGGYKDGWIPVNYYNLVVQRKRKGEYGKVSDLRALSTTIFGREHFPDRLSYSNGLFLTPDGNIADAAVARDLVFTAGDRAVYKADLSYRGKGIHVVARASFDLDQLALWGNGTFQDFVDQHEALAAVYDGAVATLRLTTVSELDGSVSLRGGYVRFGRGVDQFVNSISAVRVPVDLHSGQFSEVGYIDDWVPVRAHPDSHVAFAALRFPNFEDCAALAVKLHQRVRQVRCVGWDLTVDEAGDVKVLEWNGADNDIKFHEVTQGPCFHGLGWERLWRKGWPIDRNPSGARAGAR